MTGDVLRQAEPLGVRGNERLVFSRCRTDAEAESAGLDVSEHGMWGYPELFSPVPGGYGTDGSPAVNGGWRPTPVPEAG